MKSTRQNYTKYYMLGHATNPFREQSWGYNAEWWSFEEAMDQYVDGASDGVEGLITSGESEGYYLFWDGSVGLEGSSDAEVFFQGDTWVQAQRWKDTYDWSVEYSEETGYDYTGVRSAHGDNIVASEATGEAYLVGSQYRGGKERLHTRMGQSANAQAALHAFFPDLPVADSGAGESYIDGQSYITKMMNVGIYYQVPPLTSKGFLDNTRPFAIASKNTYLKMSNTYATDGATRSGGRGGGSATAIDPCPHCNTIGRANNGWHEMSSFFKGHIGGAGAYMPTLATGYESVGPRRTAADQFWETNIRTAYAVLVAAGIWDEAAYETMIDHLDIEQNTYGTAAFTSFFLYENWYGIMTTYNPLLGDIYEYDDMFSLSFYHPRAIANQLNYTTNIISTGGYPDNTNQTNTAVGGSLIGGQSGSDYEWVNSVVGSRTDQSMVPKIPYINAPDAEYSIAAADALDGTSVSDHGAIPSAGHSVNYHNNKLSTDIGKFVKGDKYRRFQRKHDTASGDLRSIGSYTNARGFIANKAWILQNMVPIWNGKLDKQIKQQLTKNLDIDLMHPVGDSTDTPSYTSSTSAPTTTTSGDSSY